MMTTRSQTPSSIFKIALSMIGLGLVIFVGVLLLANLIFSFAFLGKVMPGVTINGTSLSGQTIEESARTINLAYDFPDSGSILLVDGDSSWLVKPSQLGFYLDSQASAQAAFNVGRSGNLIAILVDRLNILNGSINTQPTFVFNEDSAIKYLNALANEINQPVREASVSISGTEVSVLNGQRGRVLDIPATMEALTKQVQSMTDGVVPLVILESEPMVLDAEVQGELARNALSQPLVLSIPADSTGQNVSVQIEPSTLAPMLSFEKIENTDNQYQIKVNQALMTVYLNSLQESLNLEPANARFIFNDETRQLDLEQHAVIGRTLDVAGSIAAINEVLQKGEHTAALSFSYTDPQITDQTTGADLGITELVSSYTSYFRGSSAERLQNIKIASSSFHGLLIPPGATLSMSDILGDVSLDNGYAEALIILGDQSIKGVGGGVCQVSTTLFRTAFFGGYQIDERSPHTYRVYYYEQTYNGYDDDLAGLDATVFVPLVDFKFTNDSQYWLLMETYVSSSNYSLTWKFYSTKDGREINYSTTGPTNIVDAPDPIYRENSELAQGVKKQVDWAADGADVSVTRTVTKDGTVIHNDTFFTRYEAWADVFEYGPGTEGIPTPTQTP